MRSRPHSVSLRRRWRLLVLSLAATALIVATLWLPLWTMTLDAPQYPAGLYMRAYGSHVAGDLREINIINHYVGMEEIDPVPAPEMALYPYAIIVLAALALLSVLSRAANRLALLGIVLMPVVTLADLQWWLHRFGQNLDPTAPLRFIEPFTPLAIGISKIGNFRSTAMVSYGFFAWGIAAVLLYFALKEWRDLGEARAVAAVPVAAVLLLAPGLSGEALAGPATANRPARGSLQARIDRAPAGATLAVAGGVHAGPIWIDKPLTLLGREGAVIEGDGRGSVVEIEGSDVTVRGFTLRGSGRAITAEAAGIKAIGDRHLFADNRIEDVYFGVHLADGEGSVVRGNRIAPGERDGVRPGHAVSLWYQRGVAIEGNVISDARDGIYLSFADDVRVVDNEVTGSRYGVHSMYSRASTFLGNRLEGNLVGTALMYSSGLTMRCNRIERHRRGATAYAILLKDIDDLLIEGNLLAGNRVGIYADSTPLGRDTEARVRGNLFIGNDAALALQSTARLTFVANTLLDNLLSVRAEGGRVSAKSRWSEDGRGNYWDDYNGFDHDGDGVGDVAYRFEAVMNELIQRRPSARAFLFTPAHLALESAARMFPLFRPEPLVVDTSPLMRTQPIACPEVGT